jgi:hypothetical protein
MRCQLTLCMLVFAAARWDPLLNMITSGLVPLLGHPLMAGMCKMAHELEQMQTHNYKAYMLRMLQVRRAAVVLPGQLLSSVCFTYTAAVVLHHCTHLAYQAGCSTPV